MRVYNTLFLFIFTFIIISCYKSNESSVEPIDQSITINEAKAWFEKTIKPVKAGSRTTEKVLQDRYLNWEYAKQIKSRDGIDGILIPVAYESQGTNIVTLPDDDGKLVKLLLFQQAVIFKDKKGEQRIKLLQLAHLDKNYDVENLNQFNGYIINTKWDGSTMYFERWKNGNKLHTLYPINPGGRIADCITVDVGFDYTYIDKDGVFTIAHQFHYVKIGCNGGGGSAGSGGSGGSGGGGGGNNTGDGNGPDTEDHEFDPNFDPNSGGIGGGNNGVINNLQKACFVSVLNKVLNNSFNNVVQNMLLSFQTGVNWDITFQEMWMPLEGIDATTQGHVVTLNLNALQNASEEYIAITMYHEIIHAFLPPSEYVNADHNKMANEYVKPMAEALLQMFPNMPAQDAYDLAWAGLEGTRVFDVLSEKYVRQLVETNAKYKSYGGRNALSKGTYCN